MDPIMLEQAEEEGVKFKFLVQANSFHGDESRYITEVTVNKLNGDSTGDSNKKNADIPNEEFNMKCSSVLIAIGRGPKFLSTKEGWDKNWQT